MPEQIPRYVVTDRGTDRPDGIPRWFVYDYGRGGIARKDDGTYAEFATRREAYEWQRAHQEPLGGVS